MRSENNDILNLWFKNASTKPIRIDFVDEAWLTLVSLSHEIRTAY